MSSARTDFQSSDPTLRPPKFQRRRADMFHGVVELIEDQERYQIVSKDEAQHRIKASVRSSLGSTHEVEIWVEGDPNGPVSVHMTSTKKGGILPDLGAAKRNIREFTRLLHYRQS
jgi:uncharacterized protein DUF1499